MPRTSEESLKLLADAVWQTTGNDGECPPERYPAFRQLDDLITTTAWGTESREEFFRRWVIVERATNKRFEVGSFAELAHLVWQEAAKADPDIKHPLAPSHRRMAIRPDGSTGGQGYHRQSQGRHDSAPHRHARQRQRQDRSAIPGTGALSAPIARARRSPCPDLPMGTRPARFPFCRSTSTTWGSRQGEARGGRGAAPIPARMLVKLAAAPSAFVRHGERFVTYQITFRDLRDALYPPEYLDGRERRQRSVGEIWPRIREAIRIINQEARIPILDPKTGYGHYHHLLRINENFGRIDLDMPVGVVLDIPPEVEGGVQLPTRLDQWGAESAPSYRALLGFLSSGTSREGPMRQKAGVGCVGLGLMPTNR